MSNKNIENKRNEQRTEAVHDDARARAEEIYDVPGKLLDTDGELVSAFTDFVDTIGENKSFCDRKITVSDLDVFAELIEANRLNGGASIQTAGSVKEYWDYSGESLNFYSANDWLVGLSSLGVSPKPVSDIGGDPNASWGGKKDVISIATNDYNGKNSPHYFTTVSTFFEWGSQVVAGGENLPGLLTHRNG